MAYEEQHIHRHGGSITLDIDGNWSAQDWRFSELRGAILGTLYEGSGYLKSQLGAPDSGNYHISKPPGRMSLCCAAKSC